MWCDEDTLKDLHRWVDDQSIWITDDMRDLAIRILKNYAWQMEEKVQWYGGIPATTRLCTIPRITNMTKCAIKELGIETVGDVMRFDKREILLRYQKGGKGRRVVNELNRILEKLEIDPRRWI